MSGLPGLAALKCHNNQLTKLNVSGLSNMYALYCNNNQLTALDVSGLSRLQALYCHDNQLTALTDKSGHTLTVTEPRHGTVHITDYRIPFTPDEQPTFTLTAVPAEKYAFAQWKGLPEGISSNSNPVTFSLDGDLNAEAIFKVKLTDDMVTVLDQVYTGREIKPEPVVSAVIDGKRVVFQNGTDFTCSYADNISAGTASVTVTPTENGLLTQTAVTKTFAIRKSDSEFTGGILLDHADGQYTYGETILFSVTPAVKPALRSLTAAEHTVDFYCGGTKLNDTPVTAAEGTAAVFAYDTGKKGIPSGTHTIIAVYGGSGSLNGTEETAEVTLRKATITITADDQQASIGAAKPELTYTVSGLAAGDTLAAEPTLTCDADMDTIGQYPITASGAAVPSGGNYNEAITYVPGTLTVTDPTIAVTGVTLNKTSMTLIVGSSEQLTATVTPGNATDQTVTWASSNTAVAKVDSNGTVAAVSGGNATITVTTADGGKTANCIVTVEKKTPPPAQYSVTVQAGTGGTASASPTSATVGTKITLIATPNRGYQFKEWQVISGGVTISGNSFTMPAANVTVKAVFERDSNGGGNPGGSGSGGGSSSGGSGSSSGDNGSSGGGSTIVARPDETKPDTPTTSQTKPAAPDKNGNAAVDHGAVQSAIGAAKNDAKKNGNTANGVAVVIPITPKEGQNSFNVTINAQTLNTLVRENVKRLEINIEGVVVGGMDTKLLKWLDTLSANGDVIFRVKQTDPSGLSKEAKAAIGTRPVYDLSLVYLSGGKETPITDFGGHTIAVRLPYAPAKEEQAGNLYAVYVDGKGKVEWLTRSSYDPDLGTVVFEAGHFSIYGIGYKNPAPDFTDIKNHWAADNIIFVASRGLLAGTGNNQFSPDTGMTRGMFVTALGRLAGIDQADYKTGKFTDVKADAYYAPYVNWAAEKGIVNGTSATTFSPDTNITREQMAVIMANYAKKLGYDLPVAHEAVTFADNAQISGWAAKEVKAMQQAGIMAGKGGNRFDPKGTATRAEVATVLRRFVEIVIDPQTAQGWMQNHSGSWQYLKNGKPVTGWLQDDKKWYWLDSNGWMFAGGFKQIDGKWYYFYADGSMSANTTIDGYTIGPDGVRKQK